LSTWTNKPFTLEKLKEECLDKNGEMLLERHYIDGKPNGVLFDRKENTVYYTCPKVILGWFGIQGYVGKTLINRKMGINLGKMAKICMITPNGIDIDRSSSETTLVVSLYHENAIARMTPSDTKPRYVKALRSTDGQILGRGPDGLLCLKNGDVLVAAFWSNKILYLSWNGMSYADPVSLVGDVNNPTDLVIGPSSLGGGEVSFCNNYHPLACVASWSQPGR